MKVSNPPSRSKILFLVTKGTWGGAQRYVYDLAVASQEAGFEVTVAYGTPGALGARLKEARIRCLEIPELARDVHFLQDAKAALRIWKLLRNERPNILHLNSSKVSGIGALFGRLLSIKHIIFTAHGWAFNEDRSRIQKVLIGLFHYITVLLSHHTIAVSKAIMRDAAWMPGTKEKFVHIPLGITEPDFIERSVARATLLPKKANHFWIGMIAELHPTKRITDAIDAIEQTIKDVPDAILLVMGEGDMRKELERRISEKNLREHVHLLGHVRDAAQYLRALDIFIFPSLSEAAGYAGIEAGYAGISAIMSNVGGLPEIITNEKSGILIPPRSPDLLAEACINLAKDPVLRSHLGSALRADTEKRFSLQAMVEKTLSLYRS